MRQRKVSREKNASELPPEIYRLGEREGLGELRKVYTISRSDTNFFGGGCLCIACCVGFVLPIIAVVGTRNPSLLAMLIVAALILLIAGLYMMFTNRPYAHWHIYLWQDGFIYEKGRILQVFRWDQIDSIQCKPFGLYFSCKVCRRDGYQVSLTYVFSGIRELLDCIFEEFARQCTPQELIVVPPQRIKTFISGIKLDRQGVGNAQGTFSWQEIQHFITKDGRITLIKETGEPSTPWRTV